MTLTPLTNSTSPNTVNRATAGSDPAQRQQVNLLADNFDNHDHAATKGLGARRIQTGSVPAAAGEVQITTDKLLAHDGIAVRTAYLNNTPAARAFHNAAQSLTSGVATALALNSERFDTDTIHDNATNNSRLTCRTAGVYQITGTVSFASNATGYRDVAIRLNGATPLAATSAPALNGADHTISVSTLWSLAVNDYVELIATQTSGGGLNVQSSASYTPEFAMVRVG